MLLRLRFGLLALLLATSALLAPAHAEVKLASIFGDSMVLQQGMPVPVFGKAAPGEEITVTFAGQTQKAKADDAGKWQVKLDALKANKEGQALTVAGSNTVELKDVLVGEVWICSGQSNMEWTVGNSLNPKQEIEAADHPQIRLFDVDGHLVSPLPLDTVPGKWQVCSPKSIPGFTAVGYFFGRRLQKELDVPVGLVSTNWGGTRIEPWTTLEGFQSVPELENLAKEIIAREEKAKSGQVQVNHGQPAAICNAMVAPLGPFAARGAIWYQGEANGNEGDSYRLKMKALVNGWRKQFNPDLAFYWVQLANFQQPNDTAAGGDGWANIREAQRKALEMPHTGMAVITDIGVANDIHPRNKQDVGFRLAQWALNQTYGKSELVPSGPLFKDIKVEEGAIRISFDNVGSGLMVGQKEGLEPTKEVPSGKLARFAIAGEDKQWQWADATIDGNTVVVKSDKVAKPVAVRYAFSMHPAGANLCDKEGIPASPFRTDNW